MNTYEQASTFVDIYEKHLEHVFNSTTIDELDVLRKYLIRDIRLINAIMFGYSQVENGDYYPTTITLSELIKINQEWRENFYRRIINENEFLTDQYLKNQSVFIKAVNFYFKEAYIKYGVDEEIALDIVSKITNVPKEKLKEAKEKETEPTELEKHVKYNREFVEKTYDFKTNTIHSEMHILLENENYENLDLEDKINVIEKNLKSYIIRIMHSVLGFHDFFRDFEKSLEDWVQLISVYSNNPNNMWDIINYLLWIIGTIKSPFNIVMNDDAALKDQPCIDTDKMLISVNSNTAPIVVFKTIYEKLFNIEYLEKGISLKKQY